MIHKLITLFFFCSVFVFGQQTVQSPNGAIVVSVKEKNTLHLTIDYLGVTLVKDVNSDLIIEKKGSLVSASKFKKAKISSENKVIEAIIPTKNKMIQDSYNLLTLNYNHFNFEVRVYNNGIAYRYVTKLGRKDINISNEILDFNMTPEFTCYLPEEKTLISHFENYFKALNPNNISKGTIANLPLLFTKTNTPSISFTESNIYDYPHLFLQKKESGFKSIFPKVVLSTIKGKRDRAEIIGTEANYIAKTSGNRAFPWRVFMISPKDSDIISNNLVYQLANPLKIKNVSWIKPGKVAWDWWNANNIDGVDFESGINTETYKYYIDFASKYGLEYIILDEGWSKTTLNVKESNPNIDIPELVAYGKDKGVDIILWSLWRPLDEEMDTILTIFKNWGVKGVKIDFIQRADQYVVNFYERMAKKAAEYKMLVDYHGAFKPSGLRRAYPNVINYEGVKGLENCKWEDQITSEHELTLPFTRMTAGIMDFTPGGLDNVHKENFAARLDRPMVMGTRAHQLAMYVIYEAPLQMLSDTPSNYYREHETTDFISKIPTVWEKSLVLEAKVSDYIMMARKNGDTWYIGAMNDETPKEFIIDFSFLDTGNYHIRWMRDGVNSDKIARDYSIEEDSINNTSKMNIRLNKSGGWVAIITKSKN
ncbi:glycoside hydrolase family 97 protein [Wenyingzhuangia marina]|uniref:Alpha-glucosidase n=1 Tax=Wenyingzhuangia marina TaxID=1195760 RepID=A0A1M5V313_9FLAO|nr:glycoside hydrolase family 97 protein [Wenyingzhuangia marina]GGF74773.1 alpha-glucosidase [Wenyingzhuangia marina]SHH69629.1 alpha-glucosidase [Wenyingzhuangia marina]